MDKVDYKSKRYHLILDAHNIDPKLLGNVAYLGRIIEGASRHLEMNILHGPVVLKGTKDNPGLTAFAIIDYSHISIHTFIDVNEMNIDIFSCKPFDYKKLKDYIKEKFMIKEKSLYHGVVRYDQIDIEYDKKKFEPDEYLNEYYTVLSKENKELLKWFHNVYKNRKYKKILEVGGGPTIYQLISASSIVGEIYFTDYLKENIEIIKNWFLKDSSFWDKYISYTLKLEGVKPSKKEISVRKNLIKLRVKNMEVLDLGILNDSFSNRFDVVQSSFCIEAATNDISEFKRILSNVNSYLKEKGRFNFISIEKAKYYKSGEKYFPAIYLEKDSVKRYLLEAGFKIIGIKRINADNLKISGYSGFLFVEAEKV